MKRKVPPTCLENWRKHSDERVIAKMESLNRTSKRVKEWKNDLPRAENALYFTNNGMMRLERRGVKCSVLACVECFLLESETVMIAASAKNGHRCAGKKDTVPSKKDRVVGNIYLVKGIKMVWKTYGFVYACMSTDCKKIPSYGMPDDDSATYCAEHKKPDMEDIKNKRCLDPECKTRPHYGMPDDDSATYCEKHKNPGMEDIVSKRCLDPECKRQPCYGMPDDDTATYCEKHKKPDMEDIKNKRCLDPECKTRPCFGMSDDDSATYCGEHKKPGMEDIRSKRCLDPECKTRPCYGMPDDDTATYCVEHKKPGMEDIKNKRCLDQECKKGPCYGMSDDDSATYCAKHKKPGMEDITNKRCLDPECDIRASFPDKKGNKRMLCGQHAYMAGTAKRPHPGCSIEACECFDRLEKELGIKIQHKHFKFGKDIPTGTEYKIPGTNYHVDGYDVATGDMYEYHGNAFHGYPPDHVKFDGCSSKTNKSNASMYNSTMDRMQLITANTGHRMFYVWGHEFIPRRRKLFDSIQKILHEA